MLFLYVLKESFFPPWEMYRCPFMCNSPWTLTFNPSTACLLQSLLSSLGIFCFLAFLGIWSYLCTALTGQFMRMYELISLWFPPPSDVSLQVIVIWVVLNFTLCLLSQSTLPLALWTLFLIPQIGKCPLGKPG